MSRQASILAITIIALVLLIPVAHSCKDLVAIGDATAGDYTIFLKVRDPSRPGPQVLVKIPAGYTYTYHAPWINRTILNIVTRSFIGVASANDTPPNIIKAGMTLTDAGLAYGDADTGSRWTNPSPSAWDDFDWLRYAYQTATTTQDAARLLTTATTNLHATSVSENLFIIGPTNAYLIEADAYHTQTIPITSILAMSNYPKALWTTQLLNTKPLAATFNTTTTTQLKTHQTLRLGSTCGIHIDTITDTAITVHPTPRLYFLLRNNIRTPTTLTLGQTTLIGPYHLTLTAITDNQATIRLAYQYNDWETILLDTMNEHYGSITTADFMNWSRLHTPDLQGLRGLCEDTPQEAAMIYQIPSHNASFLSSGWFAANHACSSIYSPVHVCDTTIDANYTTPTAATLSYQLLTLYGHGDLSDAFHQTEQFFLAQNALAEFIASLLPIENATRLLTLSDTSAQHQAILTEYLWLNLTTLTTHPDYPLLRHKLEHLWTPTAPLTLDNMKATAEFFETIPAAEPLTKNIGAIANSIVNTTIQTLTVQGIAIPQETVSLYEEGKQAIAQGNVSQGIAILLQTYGLLQALD